MPWWEITYKWPSSVLVITEGDTEREQPLSLDVPLSFSQGSWGWVSALTGTLFQYHVWGGFFLMYLLLLLLLQCWVFVWALPGEMDKHLLTQTRLQQQTKDMIPSKLASARPSPSRKELSGYVLLQVTRIAGSKRTVFWNTGATN